MDKRATATLAAVLLAMITALRADAPMLLRLDRNGDGNRGLQATMRREPSAHIRRAAGAIDVLPYFLQADDRHEEWTLGGLDVLPAPDPEGSGARTCVATKFHSPDYYEVFRITPDELQIRYEVFRPGGISGQGNWIRRFEEIGGQGDAPGSVWMRRRMVPGRRVTTRSRIDRFTFDTATRSYVHDPARSLKDLTIVISVHEVRLTWPHKDLSGFGVRRGLRLVSDWHPQGQVIETYDYARGKGMVNWRWLERISTLPRDETFTKPGLHRCMDGSGLVEVVASSEAARRPAVYRCDPKTGAREAPLEVVLLDSAFRKDLGKTWYVVFRDLSKEGPLVRQRERVPASYTLPEWTARPGATIADLPYVNTRPPAGRAPADAPEHRVTVARRLPRGESRGFTGSKADRVTDMDIAAGPGSSAR